MTDETRSKPEPSDLYSNKPLAESSSAPDPYCMSAMKVNYQQQVAGADQAITSLELRKPTSAEYFRVNADPNMSFDCAIYVHRIGMENSYYLLHGNMVQHFRNLAKLVTLRLVKNRQGVVFIWPVAVVTESNRRNLWITKQSEAALLGQSKWISMSPQGGGGYLIYEAQGKIPEPQWPSMDMQEVVKLAFPAEMIVHMENHPILDEILGRV